MFFGAVELIVLMFLSGGGRDIVSLIDPADYFQSRGIAVSVDTMLEQATKDPTDAKTQIAQLTALHWMALHADQVKKAPNFADIQKKIEAIATGKSAQDLQGFATEYATKAAIALGSKMDPPAVASTENSVRDDAMRWFPKNATLVGAIDVRAIRPEKGDAVDKSIKQFLALIPAQAKQQMYGFIEKTGNMRLERISFAWVEGQNGAEGKTFVRITGKANHDWLLSALKSEFINAKVNEEKTFRGRKVSTIAGDWPPAVALIGNADLILAGRDHQAKDHLSILNELLEIRRGKNVSVLEGDVGKLLKTVASNAAGTIAGDLPLELKRSIAGQPGSSLSTLPDQSVIQLIPQKDKLKMELTAALKDGEQAKKFVTEINNLKQMGIQMLQNPPMLPPGAPNMGDAFKHLQESLQSLKIEAVGKSVKAQMNVHPSLGTSFMTFRSLAVSNMPAPPPPVPKKDIKE